MSICQSYFDENIPRIVVKSLFQKYDTDKSGSLQKNELKVLLEEDLGLDPGRVETVMMLVDKNGDGDVSFDEFYQWLRDKDGLRRLDDKTKYEQLRKAVENFKKFDADASGTIEPNELKELLKAINDERSFESVLKTFDKDGDGKISFPEFLEFFSKDEL